MYGLKGRQVYRFEGRQVYGLKGRQVYGLKGRQVYRRGRKADRWTKTSEKVYLGLKYDSQSGWRGGGGVVFVA